MNVWNPGIEQAVESLDQSKNFDSQLVGTNDRSLDRCVHRRRIAPSCQDPNTLHFRRIYCSLVARSYPLSQGFPIHSLFCFSPDANRHSICGAMEFLVVAASLGWLALLLVPWRPWGTGERLEPADEPCENDFRDTTLLI